MAKILINLNDWVGFLEGRVNIDLYVYGGNGELFVNQLPRLTELEHIEKTDKQTLTDVKRVLTLLQKRLFDQVDIYIIHGEDCSGLAVGYLMRVGILKKDTNANGLYEMTKHHPVPLDQVQAGDYLFDGTDDNKWHVGYAVSEKYAIEAQNHDVGVTKTVITDRPWKYATRPDWYEKEKPVLTRELKLTDPYMTGDDVRTAQELLIEKGYNPGKVDGIFGKNTEIASKNFKHDNGLNDKTGTIGKKTAEKLGFIWEG